MAKTTDAPGITYMPDQWRSGNTVIVGPDGEETLISEEAENGSDKNNEDSDSGQN